MFTSFLIDIANILISFVSAKFSDIYFSDLIFINNSIFEPPWRLNGDRAIGSA